MVFAQYRLYPKRNENQEKNGPCLIWVSCYTLIASLFSIIVPILFFIYLGDILVLTHMDMINSIALLTGLITLPSALFIVWAVAQGNKINPHFRVAVCPLWFSILCIMIVNIIGIVHCVRKIVCCDKISMDVFERAMHKYRTMINYRRFVDNLQWNLRCCGLQSYKDWFRLEWYDKSTETDWVRGKRSKSDCVPFSCCKSGSCISFYLTELGTYFINKRGCGAAVRDLLSWFIIVNLVIFSLNIIAQIATFSSAMSSKKVDDYNRDVSVHMMGVNQNFKRSSTSRTEITSRGILSKNRRSSRDLSASKTPIAPSDSELGAPSVAPSEFQMAEPSEFKLAEPSEIKLPSDTDLAAPSTMTVAPSATSIR